MAGLNPLTLGDTPEEYTELDDGSVLIPDEESGAQEPVDFDDNLVTVLTTQERGAIARELIDLIDKDKEARKKRDEQYAEGIRRTGLGNDAPGGAAFEGSSKVVHPVLAEGCVDFSASTMKELFPPDGPVKTKQYGQETDPVFQKAQRKKDFLNWQLTEKIEEYADELEQLLVQLPLGGSQFLKFYFDTEKRRPAAEFVPVDDIILPFAAVSFYNAPRVTHNMHLDRYTFEARVRSGLYEEPTVKGDVPTPERSVSAEASDKVEGVDVDAYNEDGLRDVYEVYVWREIEKDTVANGKRAPYIITVDAHTEQVVGIYRNWEEQDQALRKLDWLVEWKFIPWRGAYGIGLPHLIGGLAGGATGALRALLDSAHLNNAATAVKLKGGRTEGQTKQVEITQILELDAPAGTDDIRKVIMPMPFPPPSPVLFQLLGFLTDAAKGVVSTAEEKIADASSQMPVGTTLALIEQGSKVFSSIHARLHRSQRKCLQVLGHINRRFMEDNDLGPFANQMTPEDFLDMGDVVPVSDPNIFSEAQRFAQMQGVQQMTQDPRVPWNVHNAYRRALRLMRVENPDEILPPPPTPVTADPLNENLAAQQGAQLKANPQQDHMAHIQGHLGCVQFGLMNPLANPQALMALLQHVGEHITLFEHVVAQMLMQQVAIQAQVMGQQMSPDAMAAMAQQQAQQLVLQQLGPILQSIPQMQQALQQKMPPPPMPPEVQASIQIAQMDQDRRSKMDEATLNLKSQEQQIQGALEQTRAQLDQMVTSSKQQREQYRLSMEAAAQQFEQRLALNEQQSKNMLEQLTQQVELMKNDADNRQKQMTELLKNSDDNRTQIIIEKMKAMMAEAPMQGSTPAVDLAPQLEKLSGILEQIGQSKTNDALASVMTGLQATIEGMNRPKTRMLLKDKTGKTIGMTEE